MFGPLWDCSMLELSPNSVPTGPALRRHAPMAHGDVGGGGGGTLYQRHWDPPSLPPTPRPQTFQGLGALAAKGMQLLGR